MSPDLIKMNEEGIVELCKHFGNMITSIGISQGNFTLSSNPHYHKLRDIIEQINQKAKSEDLTQYLHDISIHVNKYQSFGTAASKMANAFKKTSYTLNSVESFYLQVHHSGS
jgi:hypothetical protein